MRFSVRLVSTSMFFVLDGLIVICAVVAALLSADSAAFPLSPGFHNLLAARLTFSNILRTAIVFAMWSFSARVWKVYERPLHPVSEALRIGACVAASATILGLSFGEHHLGATPLHLSLNFAMFCFGSLLILRTVITLLTGSAWTNVFANRNVLIVGSGPDAVRAYKELRTRLYRSHRVFGFVGTEASSATPGEVAALYRGTLDHLENILFDNVIDEVVIALPARTFFKEIEETIAVCVRLGVEVTYPGDPFAETLRRRHMEDERPRKTVVVKPWIDDSRLFIKRCIDIVVSFGALLILSPIFLIIALAIKATSPGPVFFVQSRYGLGRRHFQMFKFRTMIPDAEAQLAAVEALNEASGPIFKIKNDPRLTKIGGFLRRTSLDELPQLFNVLVGDMALVGPRPMSVRDVSRFSAAWLIRRFSVKPGITCLWQVKGRSNTTFDRWMELDMLYIDSWTLRLDAQILALTIPAVLRGHGAM